MIEKVHSVGFTVSDANHSLPFYTEVLPFEVINDVEVWGEPYERLTGVFGARLRVVTLQLGDEQLQLTQYVAPPGGRSIPADSTSDDLWFQHVAIVVSDMDAAYEQLRKHNVQHVSTSPQTLPDTIPAAAGIRAFYFRDPDGHNLELIWFPQGKGNSRWQSKDSLFLGIDHTAIAVGNTGVGKNTYETHLGFQLGGESINFGTEQEHLNGVFGCRVRITGLRPTQVESMGIEFLDYLTPPGGRQMPQDTTSNDLWHWEATLVTADIERVFKDCVTNGESLITSQIVTLPEDNPFGYTRAFMLRDPDGHALKIVEG